MFLTLLDFYQDLCVRFVFFRYLGTLSSHFLNRWSSPPPPLVSDCQHLFKALTPLYPFLSAFAPAPPPPEWLENQKVRRISSNYGGGGITNSKSFKKMYTYKYIFFRRWNINYSSSVGKLGAVGIRPCSQAVVRTLSRRTLDWPAGPILATSSKLGCTL